MKVFMDENGNLYVAKYHAPRSVWIIWNQVEKYLGLIPKKDAEALLEDLGAF